MTRSGAGSGFELENEAQKQVLDGFGLGYVGVYQEQNGIHLQMNLFHLDPPILSYIKCL